MTEKEMFINMWEREFATTLRILKQLPADKAGFKPAAEKTKTAKELATVFIAGLGRPAFLIMTWFFSRLRSL